MESGYALELLDYLDKIPISSENTSLINEIYKLREMCNNDNLTNYDFSNLRRELKKFIATNKEYEKMNEVFDSFEEDKSSSRAEEISVKEIDEEDALYNDYRNIKRKIASLNNYINNLKTLLTNTELINDLFQNETSELFKEYKESVIKRIRDEKSYNEEYERIANEGDKIYKLKEKEFNSTGIHFDQVEQYGNIRNVLCSSDKKFIEAKKELDKSIIAEEKKERQYSSNKYGTLIFRSNIRLIKKELAEAYEEIDELEHKKMDIIHRMDYIVYGKQKVKNKLGG